MHKPGSHPAAHGGEDLVVDLHTHFMPTGLPDLAESLGDPRWPRLVPGRDGQGEIVRGGESFRVVRSTCWDVGDRIAEMDRLGIDIQVISPIPVTLTYWARATDAAEFARAQNDGIAQAQRASGGRLVGIGGIPLQDTDLAIAEMRRAVGELGLCGLEIGTVVDGHELDHERFRPFFLTAAELGVPLLVHPVDGPCVGRAADPLGAFGIGMLTDTAMAARALVLGGVLGDLPDLRVCLCHGGGSFPWVYPRLRHGAIFQSKDNSLGPRLDDLVRRLYVDSLVFDPNHYPLLVHRFGPDHVVLGTDFPFFRLDGAGSRPDLELSGDWLAGVDRAGIRGRNAVEFLRLEPDLAAST